MTMTTTNLLLLLLAAYLWFQGGLGWAAWHELKGGLKLTLLGKSIIVAASPIFTAISFGAMALEGFNVNVLQPWRDWRNRRKGIGA